MPVAPLLAGSRYFRNPKLVSRQLGDETLVVPIRGGVGDLNAIFSFNALGSDLWKLMAEGISGRQMADWVVAQYDVSREQAEADIAAFLSELSAAGLVDVHHVSNEPS